MQQHLELGVCVDSDFPALPVVLCATWAACFAHSSGGALQSFLNGAGGLNSALSVTPSSSVTVPFLYHILLSGLRVPAGASPDRRISF